MKFSKNKKGLSEIVVSLILVALTVVSVVMVSVVVNNLIGEKIEKSEDCFGNFGKISINERYTCYNQGNNKVQFALSIGDVDVDEILVSISTQTETGSFTITNAEQLIGGLEYFNSTNLVRLPDKNGGKTYFYNFNDRPDSIKIAPLIGGTQCEVSDTVTDIDDC
ncbi:MAG: hypothetical protein AABY03_00555 [Nanoarchaeota archaeon]